VKNNEHFWNPFADPLRTRRGSSLVRGPSLKTTDIKINIYSYAMHYLACSANLPIGLYILPSEIFSSSFLINRVYLSIYLADFHDILPYERYLREFSQHVLD